MEDKGEYPKFSILFLGNVGQSFENERHTPKLSAQGWWRRRARKDGLQSATVSSVTIHRDARHMRPLSICHLHQPHCTPTCSELFLDTQVSLRPQPLFYFYESISPNRKHQHICHEILWGQRCNSITWLNQFKWLMYKNLRMSSSFQLRGNNCSIIS